MLTVKKTPNLSKWKQKKTDYQICFFYAFYLYVSLSGNISQYPIPGTRGY